MPEILSAALRVADIVAASFITTFKTLFLLIESDKKGISNTRINKEKKNLETTHYVKQLTILTIVFLHAF